MDPGDLKRQMDEIAADRVAGASELVGRAAAVAVAALHGGIAAAPLARALVEAQPGMGPFWALAVEALLAERTPERLTRFVQRLERAPRSLVRCAVDTLGTGAAPPLHLVTISYSAAVLGAVRALAAVHPVRLSCTESRPALEGRALAAQSAAAGAAVTLFGDAAIGQALDSADAVLVGADAMAPEWFLNKCGTRLLAAAAAHAGVPVYVAATRDKFVGGAIARRLDVRSGDAAEIWNAAPAGVEVRNPYFDATPLDLVTGVITDIGLLAAALVPGACEAAMDRAAVGALLDLLGTSPG